MVLALEWIPYEIVTTVVRLVELAKQCDSTFQVWAEKAGSGRRGQPCRNCTQQKEKLFVVLFLKKITIISNFVTADLY